MMQRHLFLLAIIVCFPWAPAIANATNLASNGDFESDGGWNFLVNAAQATGQIDDKEHHSGKRSFKITSATPFGPNCYGRAVQMIHGLRPFTTYRLSAYAKGQDVGIVWIGGGPGWGLRGRFPEGTYDWKKTSIDYTTGEEAGDFELMLLVESPTKAIWIDDVTFEEIAADNSKRDKLFSKVQSNLDRLTEKRDDLRQQFPSAEQNDARVALGLAVTDRFLKRINDAMHKDGVQSLSWSRLQLQELDQVLNETRKLAAQQAMYKVTWPANDKPATIKDGVFLRDNKPFFYAGYGHFDSIARDLPNFHSLGASLVQDGRSGPSSLSENGSLAGQALSVVANVQKASSLNMSLDFLLSPHYFPDWARKQSPDLTNGNIGFINFNVDHPKVRQVIETWTDKMGDQLRNQFGLLSVCLSNEPVYIQSGRDPYSKKSWTAWLRARHGELSNLNDLYGTKYSSFDEVPLPGVNLPAKVEERRAFFDWCSFNNDNFANWHHWMADRVHDQLPRTPTHAKIMVFFSLDRDKLGWGIDPELMCDATEIAGCDAYAFPTSATTYDWFGQEFYYDLLNSFKNQPVFNSENHLIPDGSAPSPINMNATRAGLWQGALHHQGATTIWVWEEAADASLSGSIYFRPANIFAAGRAMLDLNRFAPQVAAINQAPPGVALLYSPASNVWEEQYKPTISNLYTMLNFCGIPVTFISERQFAKAPPPANLKCIIVPAASHVTDNTFAELQKFPGKILLVGDSSLKWDAYHRPREKTALSNAIHFSLAKDTQENWTKLRSILNDAGITTPELLDAKTSKPIWGVECRVVNADQSTWISMINLNAEARDIRLSRPTTNTLVDVLSGESLNPTAIHLKPMVPRLCQLNP